MSSLLIALGAMFLQQTFASVGKVLPAVVAPLVIGELDADPAWVGLSGLPPLARRPKNSENPGKIRMPNDSITIMGPGRLIAAMRT